jgi:SAM-dependent methyltransferase
MYQLLDPFPEGRYLDIGCGTGNYTCALDEMGVQLTGIDPSQKMLAEANNKADHIDWVLATAEQLPFEDQTFDGAIATLTIHHWHDLNAGIKEAFRVLKEGAKLLIFTSTPAQMRGYWLNHFFPNMLQQSMQQMPALDKVQKAFAVAGFSKPLTEPYFVRSDLEDHFLYVGKEQPALYLDKAIRKGISSFSDLGNKAEIAQGLQRLREDVESGRINDIQAKYSNDMGDYLFVWAQKEN